MGEQRLAAVPGQVRRAPDDVVAEERGDRDERQVGEAHLGGPLERVARDRVERLLGEADEVELVDAHDDVAQAEQRADRQVAPALTRQALAHVDQHDGRVGGRRAGEHVARVLLRARGSRSARSRRRSVANERCATSIVMPCSRSARRPSVSCARSCARSSESSAPASCSSRPIRVDLPSSTDPAVATRRRSIRSTPRACDPPSRPR